MSAPRVSIVIPVFNGGSDLQKCLTALAASSYPVFECILVDDASTDGMTTRIAEAHEARVIQLNEQLGPARARNLGVEAAAGDLIFFVDADVLVQADTLEIAVKALESETRFLPDNIYDALDGFRGSTFAKEMLGEHVHTKFAELKAGAADRCPRALGTRVKRSEIMFHHEVTNQYLWTKF